MKRITFLFILTTLLLESCSPVTAIPPATETATPTAIPSRTPPPTSTAIPTATPYPPLQTQGPYLLYTRDYKSLTIMDADGSGRRQIQLPGDGYTVWEFRNAVSPNGKWIAYLTGSVDEPYDLTLNILNLKDETSLSITRLIAPGFPQNLEPVTETAFFTEYDMDCSNDPRCRLSVVASGFKDGIDSLSWSPDGKSLAFAAQIDGPSSDIYIYDTDRKSVRRLTHELANISSIAWSPNGKKILYDTIQPGTIYASYTLHIADPNNKTSQNPKTIANGTLWKSEGWIAEDTYVIWNSGDGVPPFNFRYINVETDQVKTLWKYTSESYVFLPGKKGMAFVLFQYQIDIDKIPLSSGTYFVPINGKPTKISNDVYFPIRTQGSLADSFLAFIGNEKKLYIVNVDTSSVELLADNVNYRAQPSISPDKKWIVLQTDTGVNLYSSDSQHVKTWNILALGPAWRSDSLGLFWRVHNKGLYYIPIPDGEPIWLSNCKAEDCPNFNDGVWLP